MNHLNSAAFLNKGSVRLPAKIREHYTSFKLGRVGQSTFQDQLTVIQCASIDIKSDLDRWKVMNQEKKIVAARIRMFYHHVSQSRKEVVNR